ncbi:MAG TPA: response regulator [Ktedonobacterales bacterium]
MARVLVVDDDPTIRQLLTIAFSMDGHTVETLADGREVLATLRVSAERMIVFMDIMMPYVDGLAVCHQLQDEPELLARHAVVVMTAGLGSFEPFPSFIRDALGKPFHLERALALVERFDAESLAPHSAAARDLEAREARAV